MGGTYSLAEGRTVLQNVLNCRRGSGYRWRRSEPFQPLPDGMRGAHAGGRILSSSLSSKVLTPAACPLGTGTPCGPR
jgi:hypothetical protein